MTTRRHAPALRRRRARSARAARRPSGTTTAGSTGRTRGCRRCRARSSSSATTCGEQVEGRVVVEGARHEPEALGERAPDLLAERGAGVLAHRVVDDLAEVLVGPVAPGEPDEREAGRQQAAVGEVVDRRHQLLAGEVAGHAEEHQRARPGDARAAACRGGRAAGCAAVRRRAPGSLAAPARAPRATCASPASCVGEVQAQHRAAVVGEHRGVAAGLGGDELRRR